MNELQMKKCREWAEAVGFDDSQDELVEACEALIEAAEGEDYDTFIDKLADVRVVIEQVKLTLDEEQQELYEEAIDIKLGIQIGDDDDPDEEDNSDEEDIDPDDMPY